MTRRRRPRTIVGSWGITCLDGPCVNDDGTPALYETKEAALKDCKLADMKPVRVTVTYPRVMPRLLG